MQCLQQRYYPNGLPLARPNRRGALGSAAKMRWLFFSKAYGTKRQMLKLKAIFHDGSVGMEFMTDNASQAEELRQQWLAFDCVAEVRVLDEPGWVSL